MNRFLAALALAGVTACSFVLQDVDLGAPPHKPPTCSDSYGYAITDLIITGAAGAGFVSLVRCEDSEGCLGPILTAVFVLLPIGVTYGLSAIYGITRANKCEDARLLWIEMQAAPPPPEVPPPVGVPITAPPPPDAGPDARPPMK